MRYAAQIPLPLSYRTAYAREDFLVADCNKDAVKWLDSYPNWPYPMLLILGPQASGKTHLSSVFTQNIFKAKDLTVENASFFPAVFALEDIDDRGVDEEALFHLYNETVRKGSFMLLTAKAMPLWHLPDLKTRMNTIPIVRIGMPDDTVIMSLILKGLAERQLDIESDVIDYILKHIERSFASVNRFIELAQSFSLAQRRAITVPLAKQVLEQMSREQLL